MLFLSGYLAPLTPTPDQQSTATGSDIIATGSDIVATGSYIVATGRDIVATGK